MIPFDPGVPGAITMAVLIVVLGFGGELLEARRRRREREAHEDAMEEWRSSHLVGEPLDFDSAMTYSRGEV